MGRAAVSRLVAGLLFFGSIALSGVAAVLTLVALVATLLGRRGLGISVLLWFSTPYILTCIQGVNS